ncbi:MAG: hypothetical protein LJE92_10675 [Gammaproteobacteria bacterium]|jgi:hypothetical protein|nr:hypothetical protein [Gammaproteobacteria bacterium]
MKQLSLLAILAIFSVFTTAYAMTTTYDFKVSAANEAGYLAYVDNDLTITASDGSGVNALGIATEGRYYAYLDGPSGNTGIGGLGVCTQANAACAGMSDDNQVPGEYIHMRWDEVVDILSLNIQGDHQATISGTNLHYSFDLGSNWHTQDVSGITLQDVMLNSGNSVSKSLDYYISGAGAEMYVTAMTVSAVPVPSALWLFATALIGFVGLGRRTSVA